MISVNCVNDMDIVTARMRKILDAGGTCNVDISTAKKQRTITQNASLHLWLTQMATAMSDAGFTHRKLWGSMKESFDLPVTMEMLKGISQKVAMDMFGKSHTAKLTTVEMQNLYETLNLAFGQSVGVSLPWPSQESLCER